MGDSTATVPSPAEFAGTTVFTVPEIVAGEAAVMFAYRQPRTGLWYLLTGPGRGEQIAETMTTMAELLGHDGSLSQLAAMPPGRGAQREAPDGPWQVLPPPAARRAPAAAGGASPSRRRGRPGRRRRRAKPRQARSSARRTGS